MADIHFQIVSGANIAQTMGRLSTHVKSETRKWFIGAKKKMVGQKKGQYEGHWQKLRLGRRTRAGSLWEESVRHAFTGWMSEYSIGGYSRLEMKIGLISKKTTGFIQGIKQMQKDSTISAKNRWMPIPIYENVKQYRNHPKSFGKLFTELKANKTLTYTRMSAKGQPMLLSKAGNKLLYIGKPIIFIKKIDYKFMSTIHAAWPKELQYGRNRIARAILSYQKGYVK